MPVHDSIRLHGHRCFKNTPSGFAAIKPINIIIGRNNTGKSHLLDLVERMCGGALLQSSAITLSATLEKPMLSHRFSEGTSGGDLGGNFWGAHGTHFVDKVMEWDLKDGSVSEVRFPDFDITSPYGENSTNARLSVLAEIARSLQHPYSGRAYRRLLADRDIQPEIATNELSLSRDGKGATNIIRRYITSSSEKLPRELIQRELLAGLNEIFGEDGQFTEIQVLQHDEKTSEFPEGYWEVFIAEERKGLVSLSRSGSGLKTVLLVLLNLLVIPHIEGRPAERYVFALEELENNLHPALLRRLLKYIEHYAVDRRATIFLTTHSSVALDQFGLSPHAQIVRVTHDGESAEARTIDTHFDQVNVISELGAKPSDILQANGVIWVEGPSDGIYINRWLDLYTDGRLQEGRDYQCAFYGGALLARVQFKSPEEAEKDLLNLFRINPNIAVLCDSDRNAPGRRIKDRVRRIRAEVACIPRAHIWVTHPREIENYLPGAVLAPAFGIAALPDPGAYECFFPRKGQSTPSFLERKTHRKTCDKVELAVLTAASMTLALMSNRFDWEPQMRKLVDHIDEWNR